MDRRDSRRIRVALSFRPHFRPFDLSILIAPSVVQKYYTFERAYNNSKLRGNITTKLSKISLMLFALISLIICLKKYYTRYRYNFNRNNYVITTFCILFTAHIFFLITVERMKEKYLSFNSSSTTV